MTIFESKQRNPENGASDKEMRELREAAVGELPGVYRSLFVLREIENLSTAETAECLDLSEEV